MTFFERYPTLPVKYFTGVTVSGIHIPQSAIERLVSIYNALEHEAASGEDRISSKILQRKTGFPAHIIRKDISYLHSRKVRKDGPDRAAGEKDYAEKKQGSGYEVTQLLTLIDENLHLSAAADVCIAGMGRLGQAILSYLSRGDTPYRPVVGFDSNVNKLEILKTTVPLFPASEIVEVLARFKAEIGIIAVPADAAEATLHRLSEGGVNRIVNFAPRFLFPPHENIFIQNVSIMREFRLLNALFSIQEKTQEKKEGVDYVTSL